jgi:hypothetical protein
MKRMDYSEPLQPMVTTICSAQPLLIVGTTGRTEDDHVFEMPPVEQCWPSSGHATPYQISSSRVCNPILSFTGVYVSREFGAPSIRDIAVQSMRLVRFSGAADIFWPIDMHMLLFADLMPLGVLGRSPTHPQIHGWKSTAFSMMQPRYAWRTCRGR